MSQLSDLLKGVVVEWKMLGEVGELVRGNGLPKSDFVEMGIPAIHYGQVYTYYGTFTEKTISFVSEKTARGLKKVEFGDVVITNTSENLKDVGKSVVYLGNETAVTGGHATIFKPKESILGKFLAYYTQTSMFHKLKRKYAKGTKVIDVSAKDLSKIIFPIPPLQIQKEIVRILDSLSEHLSELTAKLSAEVTARTQQYNYYREQLFLFDTPEIEHESLGEIGDFQRGKRFVKTDLTSEGVPTIHYGEMYTHYGTWANETKSFVSKKLVKEKKLRVAEKGEVVIVAAGETIEDIGKGTAWLGDEAVVIHDACFSFRSSLNPKYVAYFTRTKQFHDQIRKHISSGKISSINSKGLSKVYIPVPSIEEQNRIVTILDKFEVLTNSISEGLPKEIELRQKQYEYYRDLLLTFPNENVEA